VRAVQAEMDLRAVRQALSELRAELREGGLRAAAEPHPDAAGAGAGAGAAAALEATALPSSTTAAAATHCPGSQTHPIDSRQVLAGVLVQSVLALLLVGYFSYLFYIRLIGNPLAPVLHAHPTHHGL
jgi:hypothetical protein